MGAMGGGLHIASSLDIGTSVKFQVFYFLSLDKLGLDKLGHAHSSKTSSRATVMASMFWDTQSPKQGKIVGLPCTGQHQTLGFSTIALVQAMSTFSISTVHFQLTLIMSLFTSSFIISWK